MSVWAIAMALLVVSAPAPNVANEKLIEPPFIRKWTALTGDRTQIIAVKNGKVYYRGSQGVGALELASGRRLWSACERLYVVGAIMHGRSIYAVIGMGKTENSLLFRIDPLSGVKRQILSLPTYSVTLAEGFGYLFALDSRHVLRAIDPSNGRIVWSRSLRRPGGSESRDQLLATPAGLYVGLGEGGGAGNPLKKTVKLPSEFGIDPKAGSIRWSRPAEYAGLYRPLAVEGDVVTHIGGMRRTSIRTGKLIWRGGKEEGEPAVVGNVVVSSDQKALIGRSGASGKVLWQIPLRDKNVSYGGSDELLPVTDGQSVWLGREPFLCITRDGHEKWQSAKPFTGQPAYADSQTVLTDDRERILCYAKGRLPSLPKAAVGKQELAKKLTADYELLDEAERQQLRGLTPYSFAALLNRYVQWAKSFDSTPTAQTANSCMAF